MELLKRLVASQGATLQFLEDAAAALFRIGYQSGGDLLPLSLSEGEPTLLSIHTHKEVEVATSLPLPLRGVEQRLTAGRRAEQV